MTRKDRYQDDRYDDESPCQRCGQVDADCDCAREFEAISDLLTLGSGGILWVREIGDSSYIWD